MKEGIATDHHRRRPLAQIGLSSGVNHQAVFSNTGEHHPTPLAPNLGQDHHQVEKLAIVYATPPLSPSAQRTALDPSLATLKGRSTGMDNNDRRTRQTNAPGFTGQQVLQTSPQYPPSSTSERFRQSQLGVPSATSAPTSGRGAGIAPGYNYPYSEGAGAPFAAGTSMQASSLQYPGAAPEYPQDSTARQPQAPQQQQQQQQQATATAQQYQQYGMYNLPQQATPPSPYESVQPYPPRQSAAIEVLSNQFGVPQGYYAGGEGGPTSAPTAAIATQNVQPQYSAMSYTSQSPVGRDSLASAYASGMTDSAASSSSPAFGPQGSGYASQTAAELDNAYGSYQNELRRTFESVRDSNLAEAGNSLMRISDWLLGNAEALGRSRHFKFFLGFISARTDERATEIDAGLVRDDESMHAERLKLWNEFNLCWLAVFQKQRELTTEMLNTRQRLRAPQSLMEYDQMESMGKELIRLCDIMEKHGLVDYQMGVWEEEIMTVLTGCLDLLEDQGNPPAASLTQPSTSRRR